MKLHRFKRPERFTVFGVEVGKNPRVEVTVVGEFPKPHLRARHFKEVHDVPNAEFYFRGETLN